MAIIVNGQEFVTLDDVFYVNGARVIEARLGDGRLVYPQDRKPYGIKIVRPPYRKLYRAGDNLSFDGIAVVLLDKHGKVFEDKRYPNGVIPFDELEFPVTKVPPTAAARWYRSNLDTSPTPQPVPTFQQLVFGFHRKEYSYGWGFEYRHVPAYDITVTITAWEGTKLFVSHQTENQNGWMTVKAASDSSRTPGADIVSYDSVSGETTYPGMHGRSSGGTNVDSWTYDGRTVRHRDCYANIFYYNEVFVYGNPAEQPSEIIQGAWAMQGDLELVASFPPSNETAWTVVYGDRAEGDSSIPVNWHSTYADETFADSFEIEVAI